VGDARDVGGPDLTQHGAADGHDFGDAEAAADLDELAARQDDLFAGGQCPQHDDGGGGAVVDRRRRLGAGGAADPLTDGDLAGGAFAGGEVEFEVEVAAGGVVGGAGGGLGGRGAAEVGVQDDAGGVDHR